MKLNFNISEFNISGDPIPEDVADKILHKHILPMQPVRDELGVPMFPSLKSSYRSEKWEHEHERSGESQHVFDGDGATDWTCKDFKEHKQQLFDLIIEYTEYTRIAIYETFIHCDYKKTSSGKRQIFKSNSKSKWKLIQEI